VLENIGQWIQDVMGSFGYVGLALLLVLENLFPPIPSEVVLPLAGFFVGRGDFALLEALLAAMTGSTTGALVLYGLGRCGGWALVLRYGGWLRVSEEDLERAEGWFARHGDLFVLGARVVPFARSVVSIPAPPGCRCSGSRSSPHHHRLRRVERRPYWGRVRFRRQLGPGERVGRSILRRRPRGRGRCRYPLPADQTFPRPQERRLERASTSETSPMRKR
jgi:membrane protein YqaA with SNARE-associated domain